jgi:hypothetical protein
LSRRHSHPRAFLGSLRFASNEEVNESFKRKENKEEKEKK